MKDKVPDVLRNHKQHRQPADSVNNPIAVTTQVQSQNPINGNVNPAMTQFVMQGHPMPGYPGPVAQYPMPGPSYGMPGYPYAAMYPPPPPALPPQPFLYPQHYASPNGQKRQYEPISDPVDEVEANMTINYPLVSDWLQELTSNVNRGRDNIDYTAFTQKLTENGILRLDDLTRFSQTDLCGLAGMNIGTAARIADWAKADKGSLDGQERKGKKMRFNH
jgi:hypothetical protein